MLAYLGSPTQWFILAVICLVVFGASRLPEIARNLGKSLGILRKAKREFEEELLNAQKPEPSPEKDKSPEAEAQKTSQHDEHTANDSTHPNDDRQN